MTDLALDDDVVDVGLIKLYLGFLLMKVRGGVESVEKAGSWLLFEEICSWGSLGFRCLGRYE